MFLVDVEVMDHFEPVLMMIVGQEQPMIWYLLARNTKEQSMFYQRARRTG